MAYAGKIFHSLQDSDEIIPLPPQTRKEMRPQPDP